MVVFAPDCLYLEYSRICSGIGQHNEQTHTSPPCFIGTRQVEAHVRRYFAEVYTSDFIWLKRIHSNRFAKRMEYYRFKLRFAQHC